MATLRETPNVTSPRYIAAEKYAMDATQRVASQGDHQAVSFRRTTAGEYCVDYTLGRRGRAEHQRSYGGAPPRGWLHVRAYVHLLPSTVSRMPFVLQAEPDAHVKQPCIILTPNTLALFDVSDATSLRVTITERHPPYASHTLQLATLDAAVPQAPAPAPVLAPPAAQLQVAPAPVHTLPGVNVQPQSAPAVYAQGATPSSASGVPPNATLGSSAMLAPYAVQLSAQHAPHVVYVPVQVPPAMRALWQQVLLTNQNVQLPAPPALVHTSTPSVPIAPATASTHVVLASPADAQQTSASPSTAHTAAYTPARATPPSAAPTTAARGAPSGAASASTATPAPTQVPATPSVQLPKSVNTPPAPLSVAETPVASHANAAPHQVAPTQSAAGLSAFQAACSSLPSGVNPHAPVYVPVSSTAASAIPVSQPQTQG